MFMAQKMLVFKVLLCALQRDCLLVWQHNSMGSPYSNWTGYPRETFLKLFRNSSPELEIIMHSKDILMQENYL